MGSGTQGDAGRHDVGHDQTSGQIHPSHPVVFITGSSLGVSGNRKYC